MGLFFSTRRDFHFYLYETWILLLEQLEISVIAFALNFAFLSTICKTCIAKSSLGPSYANGVDLFMRLLGQSIYDKWWPDLATLCLKISLTVYVVCILAALLFQFLYLIRFVYRHMGFFSRIVFFIAPVVLLAAIAVRHQVSSVNLDEALKISVIPAVLLSYKCFKDARLFMPELGRVLAVWFARRTNPKSVPNREQARVGGGPAQYRKEPLDEKYGRVLGLKGQMTGEDIRHRYRELVTQYHPDKVNHLGQKLKDVAKEEMQLINEAYEYFAKKYNL
jgi:hypothetical protein